MKKYPVDKVYLKTSNTLTNQKCINWQEDKFQEIKYFNWSNQNLSENVILK